jgi:hypothetical protein
MNRLILLCSNVAVEAISTYITTTFRQDADMPGLSVIWQGKTTRHDIGLIIVEGEVIPERFLDMIYTARDLFDFTEVFEVPSTSHPSDPAQEKPLEGNGPTDSS